MNSHTLQALDFQKILEILSEGVHSSAGRQVVHDLAPLGDLFAIQERQTRLNEMIGLLLQTPQWPALNLGDPSPVLMQLSVTGSILEADQLIQLARIGELSLSCRKILLRGPMSEKYPSLSEQIGFCWDDGELVKRTLNTFDESKAVKDSASSNLRKIRRRLHTLQQETSMRAEKAMGRLGPVPDGAEVYVTLRSGRYVVAVPASQSKRFSGILHDRSASGKTQFIEPMDLVEANNALTDLENEEKYEVRKILADLSNSFRTQLDHLSRTCDILSRFDAWGSIARWAHQLEGTIPEITEVPEKFRLVAARHPLLCKALGSPEPVIPLTLELDSKTRCLVVSGPNMGGKSVLLKTAGIVSIMALCGFPVPARDGTIIPLWDEVLVDIGDEQSMEADLSTFAGHLKNLREIDVKSTDRSLVLVDELGSGTDPQEGAALGVTLLDDLTRRGSFSVVTTHMSAFKEFAARTEGVTNGSMDFDPVTLRPRYRFLPNIPGRSHAFEVASLEGWPEYRLKAARKKVEEAARSADDLLRDVEELREELRQQQKELEEKTEERAGSMQRYQELTARLRKRIEKIRVEKSLEEDRMLQEIRDLNKKLKESLKEDGGKAVVSREKKTRLVKETNEMLRRPKKRSRQRRTKPGIPLEKIRSGREFWCDDMKSRVKIDTLSKKRDRVWVWAGPMRVEVLLGALSEVEKETVSKEITYQGGSVNPKTNKLLAETLNVESEIDLRGMDREESIEAMDRYMDKAHLAGLQRVRIIHGFGRGVLMKEVGRFLKSLSFVESARFGEPGEGGDGVTIAFLGEPSGKKGKG